MNEPQQATCFTTLEQCGQLARSLNKRYFLVGLVNSLTNGCARCLVSDAPNNLLQPGNVNGYIPNVGGAIVTAGASAGLTNVIVPGVPYVVDVTGKILGNVGGPINLAGVVGLVTTIFPQATVGLGVSAAASINPINQYIPPLEAFDINDYMNGQCNQPCPGAPQEMCGGSSAFITSGIAGYAGSGLSAAAGYWEIFERP